MPSDYENLIYISALILELQKIGREHGDLPIYFDRNPEDCPVTKIEVKASRPSEEEIDDILPMRVLLRFGGPDPN